MKKLIILLLSVFLMNNLVLADNITWTGAASSDWNDPANWSGNAVPGSQDHVTIPSGTTTCKLPSGTTTNCLGFDNKGNVECDNSTLQTGLFSNSGTLNVDNTFNLAGSDDVFIATNTGSMSGEANSKINIFNNSNGEAKVNITNYGDIEATNINIEASKIDNKSGSQIFGDIFISCEETLLNAGDIKGSTAEEGGDVVIVANWIGNEGRIVGGDAESTGSGNGGMLSIMANLIASTGELRSGDGGDGGEGGYINIFGVRCDFLAILAAGYSNTGWGWKADPVAADITIMADTIYIHPEDEKITGGQLTITGRIIDIYDINDFAGVIGELGIEINNPPDGRIDFSGTHTESALFSATGDIVLFSDNIIAPTEGLDHILDPDPQQNPATTTIVAGAMGDGYHAFGGPSFNGILEVMIQNQSTSAKTLDYTYSSVLGWVNGSGGSTDIMNPFEMDEFDIDYTIPGGIAETTTDIVTMILSIDGTTVDTAYAEITGISDLAVGSKENKWVAEASQLTASPNPFVHSVNFRNAGNSEIRIYDTKSNLIRIINGSAWDGKDERGNIVAQGMYIITAVGYRPERVIKLN